MQKQLVTTNYSMALKDIRNNVSLLTKPFWTRKSGLVGMVIMGLIVLLVGYAFFHIDEILGATIRALGKLALYCISAVLAAIIAWGVFTPRGRFFFSTMFVILSERLVGEYLKRDPESVSKFVIRTYDKNIELLKSIHTEAVQNIRGLNKNISGLQSEIGEIDDSLAQLDNDIAEMKEGTQKNIKIREFETMLYKKALLEQELLHYEKTSQELKPLVEGATDYQSIFENRKEQEASRLQSYIRIRSSQKSSRNLVDALSSMITGNSMADRLSNQTIEFLKTDYTNDLASMETMLINMQSVKQTWQRDQDNMSAKAEMSYQAYRTQKGLGTSAVTDSMREEARTDKKHLWQ